jgi:CBS-domain-containing membrane protein
MRQHSRGLRVQVFCGETEQVGHVPRYQALMEYLRKEGAAGATVVRGIAGFGANSRIKNANILRLSLDLPVVLTWIDDPGRVERLLSAVRELAGSGIVTVEEVEIASYGRRSVEQLRFDLPVLDVMTREAVSVPADAPIRTAVELLIDREFRALPVVDRDRRVVGVVSSGDLVTRGGLGARLELLSAMSDTARRRFLDHLSARRIADVMTADPSTVQTSDTLAGATRLMAERKIKRLPVVDEEGRLAGILARSDVLRAVAETFPRELAEAVEHRGARTVGELMRTDAPVVNARVDLAGLLDAVASTRLNRAVVVDDENRVLGVVSDADVLRSVEPSGSGGVLGALMRTTPRPAGGGTIAAEHMGRPALAVSKETTIAEAARQMTESRQKVLCVVDDERRLLGIVDRADLLAAAGSAVAGLATLGRIDGVGDDE